MRSFRQVYPSHSCTYSLTYWADTTHIRWPCSRARLHTWDRTTVKPILHYRVYFVRKPFFLALSTLLLGQTLFTKGDKDSLANMDKQIYRLIGKATTLAASVCKFAAALPVLIFLFHRMAYRVRQGRDFVTPPTGVSYTGSYVFPVALYHRRNIWLNIKQLLVSNGPSRGRELYSESHLREGP